MKKKQYRYSVSLPSLEGSLIEKVGKQAGWGWFSRWVADKIREDFFNRAEFGPDLKKVIKLILYEKQLSRNKLEDDMKQLAIQLNKLNGQKLIKNR